MKRIFKTISTVTYFAVVTMCFLALVSCEKKVNVEETTKCAEIETVKDVEEEETTTNEAEIDEFKKISSATIDNLTKYLSVKFGKYNGEEIEWLVIDKNDDTALLLSKKILDCRNYNNEDTEVSWKDSSLREWLNYGFFDLAFKEEEKFKLADLDAYGYSFIKGDKVSLPNIVMCEKYFDINVESKQNKALSAQATEYAKEKGIECDNNKNTDFYNCGSYFLTDNGETLDKAVWVGQYGRIYTDGQAVKLKNGDGVRPIICVKTEVFSNGVIDSINANIFHTTVEESSDSEITEGTFSEVDDTEELDVEYGDSDINYIYTNIAKSEYKSSNVPCSEKNVVDLSSWKYGKTPVEWVYVTPNTQIISNISPNKSSKFGYKVMASSGPKGCYMVSFTGCDEVKGTDYDGSLYCFEDYTKIPLDELKFNNKFEELKYGEYSVLDLLKKRYEMTDISKGVYMAGDVYVNVVYIDELDDIIAKGK